MARLSQLRIVRPLLLYRFVFFVPFVVFSPAPLLPAFDHEPRQVAQYRALRPGG